MQNINKPKVIIGQYYQRPLKNHVTYEGEFWQSVYLGCYQREVLFRRQMYLYMWCLSILFTTLAIVL
jgi:hypothetical protein